MSSISVIVPVSGSVPRLVPALLDQSHRGALEVILVGEHAPTVSDARVRTIRVPAGTPATLEYNLGLAVADGEVLCITHEDVMPARDWVETGTRLLAAGWSCAAGPVQNADAGFWGAYLDGNAFARLGEEHVVSRATLGHRARWRPSTANLFLERELYERVGGLHPRRGDLEWLERIVDAGYPILCSPRLVAHHHRHQGWSRPPQAHTGRGRPPFAPGRFTRRWVC
jgi:hypothetical protein